MMWAVPDDSMADLSEQFNKLSGNFSTFLEP